MFPLVRLRGSLFSSSMTLLLMCLHVSKRCLAWIFPLDSFLFLSSAHTQAHLQTLCLPPCRVSYWSLVIIWWLRSCCHQTYTANTPRGAATLSPPIVWDYGYRFLTWRCIIGILSAWLRQSKVPLRPQQPHLANTWWGSWSGEHRMVVWP